MQTNTKNRKTFNKTGEYIIKRYKNRKIYDTLEAKYITLPEFVELVKSGKNVKVLNGNEDYTYQTLVAAFVEQEKINHTMNIETLKGLLK